MKTEGLETLLSSQGEHARYETETPSFGQFDPRPFLDETARDALVAACEDIDEFYLGDLYKTADELYGKEDRKLPRWFEAWLEAVQSETDVDPPEFTRWVRKILGVIPGGHDMGEMNRRLMARRLAVSAGLSEAVDPDKVSGKALAAMRKTSDALNNGRYGYLPRLRGEILNQPIAEGVDEDLEELAIQSAFSCLNDTPDDHAASFMYCRELTSTTGFAILTDEYNLVLASIKPE